jgi:hypothetical protein
MRRRRDLSITSKNAAARMKIKKGLETDYFNHRLYLHNVSQKFQTKTKDIFEQFHGKLFSTW